MVRTYEFYEKNYDINRNDVDKYLSILSKIAKDDFGEEEVRSLGEKGLKVCLCEGEFDLFKRIVSPFPYDDEGVTRYKYLVDAISLGMFEFIQNSPSSIMEHWAKINQEERRRVEDMDEEFSPVSVEMTSRDAVVFYPSLKEELLNVLLSVDKSKLMTIKIKDVLARQICRTSGSIYSERDVIYYCEAPLVYAGLDLFAKNIFTTSNDTIGCYDDNLHDTNKSAVCLTIDYNSLDEANKIVADTLVDNGNAKYSDKYDDVANRELFVAVPCSSTDSIFEVNQRLMDLISKFHKQDMLYGQLSLDAIVKMMNNQIRYLNDDDYNEVVNIFDRGVSSQTILDALPYFKFMFLYYDKEEDKFFENEFYYRKHRKYLEEQPNFGGKGLE